VSFATTIHASLILLFRFVPFPAAAFHRGYDFSFIGSSSMQWMACIVSALSAGVCEETGFRGYMQRPIEHRHGPIVAILISSVFFTLLHLTKDWALVGMVPVVFGAGVMLGTLAKASGTLVFCMLGHWIMDIGLFAYWWTQIAGTFSQRPIFEVGVDLFLIAECGVFTLALGLTLMAIGRLGDCGDCHEFEFEVAAPASLEFAWAPDAKRECSKSSGATDFRDSKSLIENRPENGATSLWGYRRAW
jgi:Type II CAAX prenyl endopeptidase Rce1-like